jgi:hypothetical protein
MIVPSNLVGRFSWACRAREGVDRKLPSRIAALRQWDRLTAKGLDQWDEARRVGLPAYDHPRDDMRGGLDRYRSDLRDTPWKAFFLRWVEPEITKQYDAKEEAGASPTRQKYETSPGKKYDLVEALDKGVIAMLRAAGLSAAGVTAKCARASFHRTARKHRRPARQRCASVCPCLCACVPVCLCGRVAAWTRVWQVAVGEGQEARDPRGGAA